MKMGSSLLLIDCININPHSVSLNKADSLLFNWGGSFKTLFYHSTRHVHSGHTASACHDLKQTAPGYPRLHMEGAPFRCKIAIKALKPWRVTDIVLCCPLCDRWGDSLRSSVYTEHAVNFLIMKSFGSSRSCNSLCTDGDLSTVWVKAAHTLCAVCSHALQKKSAFNK